MSVGGRCGQENPGPARFCLACGAPLRPGERRAGERAREERKVVTVLFCDLVGFTARSDNADPEDVRARLVPYHGLLRREIERFGGTVDKFIGDGVMAVSGAAAAAHLEPASPSTVRSAPASTPSRPRHCCHPRPDRVAAVAVRNRLVPSGRDAAC